ncbi:glycosyltransferase family 15 protein [Cyathus striatus]|nr:glycosyltransferase family 15 protein [Cyathus striatus]
MNLRVRYVFVVLVILVGLHYILAVAHEGYGRATSLAGLKDRLQGTISKPQEQKQENEVQHTTTAAEQTPAIEHPPPPPPATEETTPENTDQQANATFVILARNSDLEGTIQSVREMEDRFNKDYGYPYVYLNDEPFTDEFKERVQALTKAKVEFGVIPHDHWNQPEWIDEDKAKKNRDRMEKHNVIYGGMSPYRNMCRFNSGFFFKHELMQKYKWYWRIEPDVHFYCDVNFDPFLYMEQNNKTYEFMGEHPRYVAEGNSMGFLSEDGGTTYNLCHFWSNFEIADMDFWRGEAYTKFFEFLDSKGGFYYERWGDAPVHSMAASLFLPKEKIHFFNEIGYFHNPFHHCPSGEVFRKGKCSCNQMLNFDYQGYSCHSKWERLHK